MYGFFKKMFSELLSFRGPLASMANVQTSQHVYY